MDIDSYLSNFFRGTKNPNLNAMKFMMEKLDHPEKKLKAIHIAGTNGKGSTTEMLTNILVKSGYKVGKFISPHLIKYNERISINNKCITDQEVERLIKEIDPLVNEYNLENEVPVTLFELETTMALLYFKWENCDLVILEAGLGGLYDCTNIIFKPIASIITSIGYDHINILGNSLEEIAYQKAGIIKKDSNTVVMDDINAIDIFINKCKEMNNTIHIVKKRDIKDYHFDENYQYFSYKSYKEISLNLKGKIQTQNATLVLEAVDILNENGFNVSKSNVEDGLKTVIHKARFETINKCPLIIYDGAHNEQAVNCFIDNVNMYYKKYKRFYIVSILERKDYKKILEILSKDKDGVFILTSGGKNNKYLSSDELYKYMITIAKSDRIVKCDLEKALLDALNRKSNAVTFVVGSFYIYEEVINVINKK